MTALFCANIGLGHQVRCLYWQTRFEIWRISEEFSILLCIPAFVIIMKTRHFLVTLVRMETSLQWRYDERDGVSNHRRLDCLLDRLFRRKSKKTSKRRVTGLYEGNSPVTSEFSAQRASNAENACIWWRHHVFIDPHGGEHSIEMKS